MDRKFASLGLVLRPFVMYLALAGLMYFSATTQPMQVVKAQVERIILVTGNIGQAVVSVFAWPYGQLKEGFYRSSRISELENQNEKLMIEKAALETKLAAQQAQTTMANAALPPKLQQIAVTKMLNSRSQWIIRVGAANGIVPGMAVVDETGGVIGRVGTIGKYISEVIPFYDQKLQVTVGIAGKTVMGFLRGDGTVARITDIPQTTPLLPGDVVVTDGSDDLFPPGLVIGRITTLESKPSDVMQTALVELTGKANGIVMVVN